MSPPLPDPPLTVACLCAAWCRLCDDYQAVMREVAADMAASGHALQWLWIDIEDEAELVGDVDVETFPTLVLLDPQQLHFAGPVTPQAATLHRLLRAMLAQAQTSAQPADAAAQAFANRLRQRLADGDTALTLRPG